MKKGLAVLFAAFFAPASFASDAVTIGLFVPTRGPAAQVGTEVRKGAEIALSIANGEGGLHGHPLRLATAASDLSWEAAAGALVKLIYEEKAVAVVGALDGRSGHLAEQVVTRARGQVVFLTPWASEDTLSLIRIPWFFRLVPDDRQQALILAGEIFSTRRIERAAVWMEDTFDARAAAQAFEQASPPGAATLFSSQAAGSAEDLIARTLRGEFGFVVLFAQPRAAADLAARLRSAGCRAQLAGPLWLASPEFLRSGGAVEGTLLVAPARQDTKAMDEFSRMFEGTHGTPPTPPALYAHDAIRIVVEALRRAAAAPSGDILGRTLEATSMHGLTGLVRFDENRDRDEAPAVARVEAGRLVAVRRGAAAGGR